MLFHLGQQSRVEDWQCTTKRDLNLSQPKRFSEFKSTHPRQVVFSVCVLFLFSVHVYVPAPVQTTTKPGGGPAPRCLLTQLNSLRQENSAAAGEFEGGPCWDRG